MKSLTVNPYTAIQLSSPRSPTFQPPGIVTERHPRFSLGKRDLASTIARFPLLTYRLSRVEHPMEVGVELGTAVAEIHIALIDGLNVALSLH